MMLRNSGSACNSGRARYPGRMPALRCAFALMLACILLAALRGRAQAQTAPLDETGGICSPTLLPLSGRQARAVNSDPALNQTGTRASFWSTADPLGFNADGSIEAFSANVNLDDQTGVVTSTVTQVTESRGNILGGFNIMPDVASAVLGGNNSTFTIFASDRDLAPTPTVNNADGGFEIFLARSTSSGTSLAQLTNTRRSASILPSISNVYPEDAPRFVNITFVSDADDTGTTPRGQAGNANYEVYVMQLDLSFWPPRPVGAILQLTQTGNTVTNDKPAMALGGAAVVFISNAKGALRPGAPALDNTDGNKEIIRATFTQPNATATVSFRQVTTTGAAIANDAPDINGNGTQVVFSSTDTNLTAPAVQPGASVVYVGNLISATTTYAPLSSALRANPAHATTAKDPAVNAAGDRVVFAADGCDPEATTCAQPQGQFQVFAADQDLVTGRFLVVQVTSLLTTTSEAPAISGDGRFIALVTSEGNAATNPDLSGSEVAILFCPVARIEPLKVVETLSTSLAENRPDVGDNVDYVVSLSNGSPTSFSGTMIMTDTLPPQVQWLSASTETVPTGTDISAIDWNPNTRLATWTVDKLARGQKASVRLHVKVLGEVNNVPTGGQIVTNIVNMTTTAPVDEIQSGLVKIATQVTADMYITRVDLSAALNVSTQTPREQTPFTITIALTNSLPGALDPATSVHVTTTLPSLLTNYTVATSGVISGTYDPTTGLWTVQRLNAGKSARIRFRVTPRAGTGGTPPQTVTIGKPTSDQQDFNPANNLVGPASRSFRVLGTDLQLVSKKVDRANPPQFSDVTYTLVLRNNGPVGPLTEPVFQANWRAFVPNTVEVIDPLPAGLNFFSATDGGTLENGNVVWRIPGWGAGIPAPSDGPTFTVSYTAKVQAAPGTRITNTVSSVLGRLDSPGGPPLADPNPGNNAPSTIFAVITTNQAAAVNVQIKPQPGTINEGQQVTLTVRYSDPDVLDSHVVAVNWGDGQPTEQQQGPVNASNTVQKDFFHIYADDNISNTYTISTTVTDDNGQASTKRANVIVNNVLPSSTGITVTQSAGVTGTNPVNYVVRVGEPFAFRQTFRDPGFTRPPLAETFSYTITWGDGAVTANPVTSVVNGSPGVYTTGTIDASHNYAVVGTYNAAIYVRDDDERAAAAMSTLRVIVTVLPVAADDTAEVDENASVAIPVIANDIGDGKQLVNVTRKPSPGTVITNTVSGVVTYTATGFDALQVGQTAQDSFDYLMRDRFGFSDSARVTVTVNGVNDAPLLDLDSSAPGLTTTVNFREDAGKVIIAPRALITDPDDANMASAVVTLTNPLDGAAERLLFTPQAGITTTYSTSTGLLTLSGVAPKLTYQSLIASVAYTNTSQNPDTTTRVLLFEVVDPQGAASPAVAATINVARTDDPPVITTTSGTLTVQERTDTIVDPGITITDADNGDSFAGGAFTATVQAGNDAIESIRLVNGGGIVVAGANVSYNSAPIGTLAQPANTRLVVTLNASATVTATQALARQVTYRALAGFNGNANRVVAFSARSSAGGAQSNVATRALFVNIVNQPPTITFGTFPTVPEETPTNIRSSFTVSDVDTTGVMSMTVRVVSGTLTYSGLGTITNNNTRAVTVNATAVQLNQTATLIYTGDNNFFGSDTLFVSVNDQDARSPGPLRTAASAPLVVTNVNDAPRLRLTATTTDTTVSFTEGAAPTVLAPAAQISDADSPNLAGASVQITNLQNAGQETLAATAPGLTVSYNAGSGLLTITGSASLATYQAALRTVTYSNSSENPSTTPRTVDFQVSDGGAANALSNIARATVSITAIDSPTIITTSAGTTAATETTAAQIDAGILITDPDTSAWPNGTLTVTVQGGDNKDNLSLVADATVTLVGADVRYNNVSVGTLSNPNNAPLRITFKAAATPDIVQAVARRIFYTRARGHPQVATRTIAFAARPTPALPQSNTATKGIVITSLNGAPVITIEQPLTVTEDVTEDIRPYITISDPDSPSSIMRMTVSVVNGTLTYVGTNTNSGSGTKTVVITSTLALLNIEANNVINYLSFLNAGGAVDPLTVTVNDNDTAALGGAQTGTATGSIKVANVNDAPVLDLNGAAAGQDVGATFTEGAGAVVLAPAATVSDVDSSTFLSATVQIGAIGNPGLEVLGVSSATTGISTAFNAATGRLVLTGSANAGAWQTALRKVNYNNTSQNPVTTARAVTFQIFDNGTPPLGSNQPVATVTIVSVNNTPTLTLAAQAAIVQGATRNVGPSITIADVDAQPADTATFTATVGISGTLTVLPAQLTANSVTLASTNGSRQIVLTGTFANLNAWKATANSLVYASLPTFVGNETLTINYRDLSPVPPGKAATAASRTFAVTAPAAAAREPAAGPALADTPAAGDGLTTGVTETVSLTPTEVVSETAIATATTPLSETLPITTGAAPAAAPPLTLTLALTASGAGIDPAQPVIYTLLAAPGVGALLLDGAPLAACTVDAARSLFTQAQVDAGLLTFSVGGDALPVATTITYQVGNSPNCAEPGTTYPITLDAPSP